MVHKLTAQYDDATGQANIELPDSALVSAGLAEVIRVAVLTLKTEPLFQQKVKLESLLPQEVPRGHA